jgi:2-oxoglutarate ferredoxin oxidoreductase subunit alpha
VTLGGCDLGVREAIDLLARRGIAADLMRVRAFPFAAEVEEFLASHEINFVIEQNRDAQLRTLLIAETGVSKERLRSVLAYGGYPLSAVDVVENVTRQLGATNGRN